MNSTNNDSYEIAANKVFSDLYNLIKEDENKIDDKPFKFDLSIMPDDVVSCIGKHLEDYPFEIYKDTELYKMFFKHDKPDDYKEYILNLLVMLNIIIKYLKNTILQKVVKLILIFYL